MNRLVFRFSTAAVVAMIAWAISAAVLAGGRSKSCHHCGGEKQVKTVCRLVKICEEAELPSYVYTKEEVFYPDKGSICYTGFRSDTFYDFWRSCDCSQTGDAPHQAGHQAGHHCLAQLHCSWHTVCGCQTLYGAKPTGCHTGCCIRVPAKTQRLATPILKWETVSLCKDCCEKAGKAK